MPKRATAIVLSEKEQEGLLQVTSRHRSEQQAVRRARIVLSAAQGYSNAQIAHELGVSVDTVRLWRDRWAGLQRIELETLSVRDGCKMLLVLERSRSFTPNNARGWRHWHVKLRVNLAAQSASGQGKKSPTN